MFAATLLAATLAAAPSGGLVLLMQRDASVDASWEDVVRGAAKKATRANGKTKWVNAPDAGLEDTQLMLGCSALDAACISQISGLVGADVALWTRIRPEGGGAELTFTLVNSDGRELERSGPYELSGAQAKEEAAAIVRAIVTSEAPTHVVVNSDPVGASVVVDGAKKGTAPVTLFDLESGTREFVVSLDGYDTQRRSLAVERARTTRTTLTLGATTAVTPPDPEDPKDPKDPEDPKDPKDPKDPEDPGLGEQPSDPSASGGSVLPWVVVGTGVALAAAGAGSFAYYYSAHAGMDFENPELRPGSAPNPIAQGIVTDFFETPEGSGCEVLGSEPPPGCGDSFESYWGQRVAPFFIAGYALTIVGSVVVASGAGLFFLE